MRTDGLGKTKRQASLTCVWTWRNQENEEDSAVEARSRVNDRSGAEWSGAKQSCSVVSRHTHRLSRRTKPGPVTSTKTSCSTFPFSPSRSAELAYFLVEREKRVSPSCASWSVRAGVNRTASARNFVFWSATWFRTQKKGGASTSPRVLRLVITVVQADVWRLNFYRRNHVKRGCLHRDLLISV